MAGGAAASPQGSTSTGTTGTTGSTHPQIPGQLQQAGMDQIHQFMGAPQAGGYNFGSPKPGEGMGTGMMGGTGGGTNADFFSGGPFMGGMGGNTVPGNTGPGYSIGAPPPMGTQGNPQGQNMAPMSHPSVPMWGAPIAQAQPQPSQPQLPQVYAGRPAAPMSSFASGANGYANNQLTSLQQDTAWKGMDMSGQPRAAQGGITTLRGFK